MYSHFTLNHLFCFVPSLSDDQPTLAPVKDFTGPQKDHSGQGTSARFIFLKNSYIEFLWLRDLHEAQQNILKLDLRAGWETNKSSPFGVCLSGQSHPNLNKLFTRYNPVYEYEFPIWISNESLNDTRCPLVFFLDWSKYSDERALWPIRRFYNDPLVSDKILSKHEIVSVEISGPRVPSPQIQDLSKNVVYKSNDKFEMKILVGGEPFFPVVESLAGGLVRFSRNVPI